jgi:glutamate--cysteine ligase catalytic subunit
VQLTDFENAAFVVFIVLVTRVILAFDLNLYVPLSKVDENMKRAHARDAVHTQKFAFRTSIDPPAPDGPTQLSSEQVHLLCYLYTVIL